jgi:hypothetical protein
MFVIIIIIIIIIIIYCEHLLKLKLMVFVKCPIQTSSSATEVLGFFCQFLGACAGIVIKSTIIPLPHIVQFSIHRITGRNNAERILASYSAT